MKILVAEDNTVSREVLETTLQKLGYDFVSARDGQEAWELFQTDPVRLVLCDWMMPKVDGLDLCRKIRARTDLPYTYFILLTAVDATEKNINAAMDEGVDDFLAKPINWPAISARLRVATRILSYANEVRQLEELLPICMFCNKVREGGDYLQKVEDYISHKTGTVFSHGVCPSCYQEKLVPQLEEFPDSTATYSK